MTLQLHADDVAKEHPKVPAKRRKELAAFLAHTDPQLHPRLLKTFRANGMPREELDLVETLLASSEKGSTSAKGSQLESRTTVHDSSNDPGDDPREATHAESISDTQPKPQKKKAL